MGWQVIERNRMEIGDAVIVDADKNEVRSQYDDLEALPEDVVSTISCSKFGGVGGVGTKVLLLFFKEKKKRKRFINYHSFIHSKAGFW